MIPDHIFVAYRTRASQYIINLIVSEDLFFCVSEDNANKFCDFSNQQEAAKIASEYRWTYKSKGLPQHLSPQ